MLDLLFQGTLPDGTPAIAQISGEAHLVPNLKANLLIGTDILVPHGIDIMLSVPSLIFRSCESISVPAFVKPRDNQKVHRVVKSALEVMLKPHDTTVVPVLFANIPTNRDFLLEPSCEGVSTCMVNASTKAVPVRNTTGIPRMLGKHTKLGDILENTAEGCYHLKAGDLDVDGLMDMAENGMTAGRVTGVSEECISRTADRMPSFPRVSVNSKPVLAGLNGPKPSLRKGTATKLPCGVTFFVSNDMPDNAAEQVGALCAKYADVLSEVAGIASIPQEDWMQVNLKDNWRDYKLTPKVYPLSVKDKAIVDAKFDSMHEQGKMEWSTQPTPFGFPVFVVWKALPDGTRKGRVVIDIRGLNQMVEKDAYPMPLQEDIIGLCQGCDFLSTADGTDFFHQFLVRTADRTKLTVISARGSEYLNVAPMGFIGSAAHCQRIMDRITYKIRQFMRAYIDDMIIASKTFPEFLNHLGMLFETLRENGITIRPCKCFFGFPSLTLLGQYVDGLGIMTAPDKLKALTNIEFPSTLKDLEIWVGLTNWLRNYVPHYAKIIEPLQNLKTDLLKDAPKESGMLRKTYAANKAFKPTQAEIDAFEKVQEVFRKGSFLVHYQHNRRLYLDVDSSKKMGIGVMLYHVKGDPEPNQIAKSDIQPILFLSKCLSTAEMNYWLTEMETAGLVWAIKKCRKMLESNTRPTVCFTDHSGTVQIAKQTSLTTSSTDKLNLRLVRASQYLSQFDLTVVHKPGIKHVVPDAISRLKAFILERPSGDVLEDLPTYAFHISLVALNPAFKDELIKEYKTDTAWSTLYARLTNGKSKDSTAADQLNQVPRNDQALSHDIEGDASQGLWGLRGLPFVLDKDDLLWFRDPTDIRLRLVIPSTFERQIFEVALPITWASTGHTIGLLDRFSSETYPDVLGCISRHARNVRWFRPNAMPLTENYYPYSVRLSLSIR